MQQLGPLENSYLEVNVARTFVGLQREGLMTRAADCFSISHQVFHQKVTATKMAIAIPIDDAGVVRIIHGFAD